MRKDPRASPSSRRGISTALGKINLFEEHTHGFFVYRIPGLVVTTKGTVLAYCEARKHTGFDWGEIEIHLRRSTDGGRTFDAPHQIAHLGPRLSRNPVIFEHESAKSVGGPDEQTVNNPVAIVDRDGTVHFIYCVEYMRCFQLRSTDDGLTWSKPVEITSAFDNFAPTGRGVSSPPGPATASNSAQAGLSCPAGWPPRKAVPMGSASPRPSTVMITARAGTGVKSPRVTTTSRPAQASVSPPN